MRPSAARRTPATSPLDSAATAVAAMRRPAELWLLGGLLASYCLLYAADATDLYGAMNVTGPVALTAILAWSCDRIARSDPIAIWAPLFWFRLASAAYFGVGAFVPHIVNDETLIHLYSLYYFDEVLNFKVNVIYCAGIFFTLAFAYVFLGYRPQRPQRRSLDEGARRSSRTLFFALLFLTVGGVLRYGFLLPYTFRLTDFILPGALITLSKMFYVGVYLSIVYAVSYNRKLLIFIAPLIVLDVAVSVASFAKSELLLILIFSFLAFISSGADRTKVAIGACIIVFAYFTFWPLVNYGRDELGKRSGNVAGSGAGINERWQIVLSYYDGGRDSVDNNRQGGLARLSYVNAGAFVADRYDAGVPGDTLRNAAAVVIPRALWPDKPIITAIGTDLNLMVFDREDSSLGVGYFAEAYWNFGWSGIVPMMAALALVLSTMTRLSMRVMADRDWLLLPVVFAGVNMGLRVDGYFVPDILGAGWITICLWLLLGTARRMLGRGVARRAAPMRPGIRRA